MTLTKKSGYLVFVIQSQDELNPKSDLKKHWFSGRIGQSYLFHSLDKEHLPFIGEFIHLAYFFRLGRSTASPSQFYLFNNDNTLRVHFESESHDDCSEWIQIIQEMIKVIKTKIEKSEMSGEDISSLLSISKDDLPAFGINAGSHKAKRLMSEAYGKAIFNTMPSTKVHNDAPQIVFTLHVRLSESRIIKLDGNRDPDTFILFNLDGNQYRSSLVLKNENPLWCEEFSVNVPNRDTSILRASLWTDHSYKQHILGKCDITLNQLKLNAPPEEQWYDLIPTHKNSYVSGKLHVRVDSSQLESFGVMTLGIIEGQYLPLCSRLPKDVFVKVIFSKQVFRTKNFRTARMDYNLVHALSDAAWNESFELKVGVDDQAACIILQLYKVKLTKSVEIGQVTLYPSIRDTIFYDSWVVLNPVHEEPIKPDLKLVTKREKSGLLRLSLRLTRSIMHPIKHYEALLSFLLDSEASAASAVQVFESIISTNEDRSDIALHLVQIYEAKNKATVILKALLTNEIHNAIDVETLFRANSLASLSVDLYMKICGFDYLKHCVQCTIDTIFKNPKISFEIDPMKIEKIEEQRKAWSRFLKVMNNLLNTIYMSVNQCPAQLRDIFSHIQIEVEKKFDDPKVRYTSVSGFLFLRLIAASILGPKLFGLSEEHPHPKILQNLTYISRILQKIANLSVTNLSVTGLMLERELYIERHKKQMQQFVDELSQPDASIAEFNPASTNLTQDISFIHEYCEKNIVRLTNLLEDKHSKGYEPAKNLVLILDKMTVETSKDRPSILILSNGQWEINPAWRPYMETLEFQMKDPSSWEDTSISMSVNLPVSKSLSKSITQNLVRPHTACARTGSVSELPNRTSADRVGSLPPSSLQACKNDSFLLLSLDSPTFKTPPPPTFKTPPPPTFKTTHTPNYRQMLRDAQMLLGNTITSKSLERSA